MVYETKLTQNGIRVEKDFRPARAPVVKRGEITQVFANLLSNAVDAMPSGGMLRLAISESTNGDAEGVCVEIGDNGTGVPEELQAKIFEPFFTTKEGRGTGIGLWISRQFVESYKGTLWVESSTEGPHRGSRFFTFLPFAVGASG